MTAPAFVAGVIFAALAATTTTVRDANTNECRLTDADLAANAALSFDDFDQKAVLPSTARQLVGRGCFSAAARADEHYLLFGKAITVGQQRVVTFHLGQALALDGDERDAARVIAAALNPAQSADAPLDWNTYVIGVWSYLVKDRAGTRQGRSRAQAPRR